MGKIVEKKRKKKKGRPSLLDLQKRSLKQQQEQLPKQQQLRNKIIHKKIIQNPSPSPNSSSNPGLRRSTRRNPDLNPEPTTEDDDEDRSSGKRREKKLKLVLKLPENDDGELHSGEEISGSFSNPDNDDSSRLNLRKRKIDSISHGSELDSDVKVEKHCAANNQTSTQQGSKINDGSSTPLPDKKLLVFILDRLQKKDTYGVFADPVDPEELPDYHEVIEHPMDFSTVRKKLNNGAYANLEQFEKDVFLICSNAMQYNAPETIYFRQARSILEIAKKDFENLRQDSDNETQPEPKVVRRGRPPTKNLKRPPGRPPLERANSEFSESTLANNAGGHINRSNNDMRKGPPLLEKYGSTELFARSFYGSRFGEANIGWSAERHERTDDMTGSASKGISMKHGKKQIVLDENRRNTYNQTYALSSKQEPSVLTTFDWERKQLIAVGLHTEYGYARSLARFAAKLGPVAWKVASRRIERCLPTDVKFGPGWVGENEAQAERPMPLQLPAGDVQPSQPTTSLVELRGDTSAQNPKGEKSIQSKLEDGSSNTFSPPSAAGNEPNPVSSSPIISDNGAGGPPFRIHQSSNTQPRINGLNGSYGLNFATQMGKMIGAARPTKTEIHTSADNNGFGETKLSGNSRPIIPGDCLPNGGSHQKVGSTPPDLNVGFQSPGSPGAGRAESVHPDLALQL